MDRKQFLRNATILTGAAVVSPLLTKSLFGSPSHTSNKEGLIKMGKIVGAGEGRQLNVLGDKMTFKLTGEDTANQYTLIEQNNEPGVGIPTHVHTGEDEVFKVIEGRLELSVGGETTILNPGDIGFCPRNVPHSWRVVGNSNAKVDLSFFPSGLERMFEELAQLPPGRPDMKVVGEICGRYGLRFV